MKNFGLLILFSICFLSCEKEKHTKNTSEIEKETILFEKLDSIRIDYIGNLKVHDLNLISKTVLLEEGGGSFSRDRTGGL
ncbi:hypothetical protein [Nitritalea halalkaliphila]|uniref:hypothetical protein n=1 Tax=Nitritalea halalkaliphila TaxID=590849 RepID=UPI00058DD93E|nr:hypothetical protein [Nitritalea halalkaliphila]